VAAWVDGYERAWRTAGTDPLTELFSETISYRPSPWADPIEGLDGLRRFWEEERSGPDEGFHMEAETVAVDGPHAVVRVAVDYDDGERWRDLWVITLDEDGRCERFEEWPFEPPRGEER